MRENAGRCKRVDAAKTRQVESLRFVEQKIGAIVGEPAAEVTPKRVPFFREVAIDDVEVVVLAVAVQTNDLVRRILQIVVDVDDVSASGLAEPGHDGIVLAEVAREIDDGERRLGRATELPTNLQRI